ncbi:MAG: SBBP repeat-containing protein, partial [Verrucomicrobiales bacterium]|nr:SBBP repeat-containing protein [Verrucomicrobiales bacterium]
MNRICLSVMFLLWGGSSRTFAQADVKSWTRLLGTSTYDFGYAAAVDSSGNGIIAGATQGSLSGGNAGRYDLFVAKYDPAGNRLWLRQRGTDERDFAYGVAADAAGNIYVTGYTGGGLDGNSNIGQWDIFLTKFDAAGNWQWTRQVGTSQDDEGRAV